MRSILAAVIVSVLAIPYGAAADEPSPPASQPAEAAPAPVPADQPAPALPAAAPASQPAASRPAPAVMRVLEALEAAGDKYPTIKADIDYRVDDVLVGDVEERTGYVCYQKDADGLPAQFRVHFETLRQGEGKTFSSRVDWAFNGLVLSHAQHKLKKLTQYHVAAKGEKVEPLRLGRGPFPLPFGQKVDDVLSFFEVSLCAPDKGDAPNTDCLELVPLPQRRQELSITRMKVWTDRDRHLPVRLVSTDKSKNVTTVTFRDLQAGVKFDDDVFTLSRPWGWQLDVQRYDAAAPPSVR